MTIERVERVGDIHARVVAPAEGPRRGPVVLVHGICMSGRIWHRWAAGLAVRGIEVWCMDLRGHGQSGGRDAVGTVRMDDYADDVEAVLDASNARAVVGHDMGGLVAQMVAARRELRGLALVGSVGPGGLSGPSSLSVFWRELRPRYMRAILRGKAWQPTAEDLSALACGKLTEDDRKEVLSWVTPESGVAAREMGVSGVIVDELKVRCPVLVAAMTFDVLTPPARQRMISSRYHADYVEFAQHAHFPMLEPGGERPVAVIGKWLDEAARFAQDSRGSVARVRRAKDVKEGSTSVEPSPSPESAVAFEAAGPDKKG